MLSHGYVLQTNADFDRAIALGLLVSITSNDTHLSSGFIKSHTANTVRMASGEFEKAQCYFTVARSTSFRIQSRVKRTSRVN